MNTMQIVLKTIATVLDVILLGGTVLNDKSGKVNVPVVVFILVNLMGVWV